MFNIRYSLRFVDRVRLINNSLDSLVDILLWSVKIVWNAGIVKNAKIVKMMALNGVKHVKLVKKPSNNPIQYPIRI